MMYDVVVGVPKSNGVAPPTAPPPNPSLIALQPNDDPLEKLRTVSSAVSDILTLDEHKQARTNYYIIIVGKIKFRWVKFSFQVLQMYFRGLIFILASS